jgi:hypothetical protein
MHTDVHRYLDGELPRAALSAEAELELREWELATDGVREYRAERAPPWLDSQVMHALRAAPAGPLWQRAWEWLVTPRPLQIRPLAPLAGALALLLVVLTQTTTPETPLAVAEPLDPNAPVIYVQFALTAAGARSVAVAGDFNDWSVEAGSLRDAHGDGVFRGLIAVQPGVHKYMFVVDGEEWVTDPVAERYVDDGFGMRNALLAVVTPGETH